MTSNLGSRQLHDFGTGIGFSTSAKEASKSEAARAVIDKALKKHFAPEFLNRIDEIVMFRNLEKPDIFKIIDTEFAKLIGRMKKMNAEMELTESAKNFLMEKGWEPELGARPLRRCIEHYVQDELAECMLRGMNPRRQAHCSGLQGGRGQTHAYGFGNPRDGSLRFGERKTRRNGGVLSLMYLRIHD